jgi:hypothetical protein
MYLRYVSPFFRFVSLPGRVFAVYLMTISAPAE